MPITIPTIPEDEIPSFTKDQVKYKLVKMPFDNEHSSKNQDKSRSHTQLFLNMTGKPESSKGTPSYYREVCRVNDKVHNLYWYDAALKTYSGSTTLWSIDKVKMTKSKLRKIKRPKAFTITNKELDSSSVFKRSGSRNEPKGYSGEVVTPYDHSCIQRYRWVRYKDGSGWAFILRNDPSKPLVEMRKTSSKNEFEIVFFQAPPPGWSLGTKQNLNTFNPFNHSTHSAARYPSVFSNPSSLRTSSTSGLLSNLSPDRESTFSDASNAPSVESEENPTTPVNGSNKLSHHKNHHLLSSIYSERSFTTVDSERHWQEFVLASTVSIQDEVNSSKKRLWKD